MENLVLTQLFGGRFTKGDDENNRRRRQPRRGNSQSQRRSTRGQTSRRRRSGEETSDDESSYTSASSYASYSSYGSRSSWSSRSSSESSRSPSPPQNRNTQNRTASRPKSKQQPQKSRASNKSSAPASRQARRHDVQSSKPSAKPSRHPVRTQASGGRKQPQRRHPSDHLPSHIGGGSVGSGKSGDNSRLSATVETESTSTDESDEQSEAIPDDVSAITDPTYASPSRKIERPKWRRQHVEPHQHYNQQASQDFQGKNAELEYDDKADEEGWDSYLAGGHGRRHSENHPYGERSRQPSPVAPTLQINVNSASGGNGNFPLQRRHLHPQIFPHTKPQQQSNQVHTQQQALKQRQMEKSQLQVKQAQLQQQHSMQQYPLQQHSLQQHSLQQHSLHQYSLQQNSLQQHSLQQHSLQQHPPQPNLAKRDSPQQLPLGQHSLQQRAHQQQPMEQLPQPLVSPLQPHGQLPQSQNQHPQPLVAEHQTQYPSQQLPNLQPQSAQEYQERLRVEQLSSEGNLKQHVTLPPDNQPRTMQGDLQGHAMKPPTKEDLQHNSLNRLEGLSQKHIEEQHPVVPSGKEQPDLPASTVQQAEAVVHGDTVEVSVPPFSNPVESQPSHVIPEERTVQTQHNLQLQSQESSNFKHISSKKIADSNGHSAKEGGSKFNPTAMATSSTVSKKRFSQSQLDDWQIQSRNSQRSINTNQSNASSSASSALSYSGSDNLGSMTYSASSLSNGSVSSSSDLEGSGPQTRSKRPGAASGDAENAVDNGIESELIQLAQSDSRESHQRMIELLKASPGSSRIEKTSSKLNSSRSKPRDFRNHGHSSQSSTDDLNRVGTKTEGNGAFGAPLSADRRKAVEQMVPPESHSSVHEASPGGINRSVADRISRSRSTDNTRALTHEKENMPNRNLSIYEDAESQPESSRPNKDSFAKANNDFTNNSNEAPALDPMRGHVRQGSLQHNQPYRKEPELSEGSQGNHDMVRPDVDLREARLRQTYDRTSQEMETNLARDERNQENSSLSADSSKKESSTRFSSSPSSTSFNQALSAPGTYATSVEGSQEYSSSLGDGKAATTREQDCMDDVREHREKELSASDSYDYSEYNETDGMSNSMDQKMSKENQIPRFGHQNGTPHDGDRASSAELPPLHPHDTSNQQDGASNENEYDYEESEDEMEDQAMDSYLDTIHEEEEDEFDEELEELEELDDDFDEKFEEELEELEDHFDEEVLDHDYHHGDPQISDGLGTMLAQRKAAAIQIQRFLRGRYCRHELLRQLGVAKRRKWEKRNKSALLTHLHSQIRRVARAWLREHPTVHSSMALAVRKVCSIKIQSWYRLHRWAIVLRRKESNLEEVAAVMIQKTWRGLVYRARCFEVFAQQHCAAMALQAWFRCLLVRQMCSDQKYAAIVIQRAYRAYILAHMGPFDLGDDAARCSLKERDDTSDRSRSNMNSSEINRGSATRDTRRPPRASNQRKNKNSRGSSAFSSSGDIFESIDIPTEPTFFTSPEYFKSSPNADFETFGAKQFDANGRTHSKPSWDGWDETSSAFLAESTVKVESQSDSKSDVGPARASRHLNEDQFLWREGSGVQSREADGARPIANSHRRTPSQEKKSRNNRRGQSKVSRRSDPAPPPPSRHDELLKSAWDDLEASFEADDNDKKSTRITSKLLKRKKQRGRSKTSSDTYSAPQRSEPFSGKNPLASRSSKGKGLSITSRHPSASSHGRGTANVHGTVTSRSNVRSGPVQTDKNSRFRSNVKFDDRGRQQAMKPSSVRSHSSDSSSTSSSSSPSRFALKKANNPIAGRNQMQNLTPISTHLPSNSRAPATVTPSPRMRGRASNGFDEAMNGMEA